MKFIKKPLKECILDDWHEKFAWRPTQVSENVTVWLETYLRRRVWHDGPAYQWHYRFKGEDDYYSHTWEGPIIFEGWDQRICP